MTLRVALCAACLVLALRSAGAQVIAERQDRADAAPPMLSTDAIRRALQPLPRRRAPAAQDQPPAPVRRDDRLRNWEIEVHGGWMLASSGNSGTGSLPPAGVSFTAGDPVATAAGLTGTSRRVSSWYFGDGAALFNATAGVVTGSTLTPLDPVLTSSTAEWSGLMIGVRVGRGINRWLGAEFEFHHSGDLRFVDSAVSQITETTTSFQNALSATCCLASTTAPQSSLNGSAIGTYVNSSSTLTDHQGHQIFTTGNLILSVPRATLTPYATIGGGLVSIAGGASSASLTAALAGHYSVASGAVGGGEFDTVNVRVVPQDDRSFVLTLGGGVKSPITSKLGIRVDARGYFYHDHINTIVDAAPVAAAGWSQFLNTDAGDPTAAQTAFQRARVPGYASLSGPPITGFATFVGGSGLQAQFAVTAGVFWRF